MSPNEPLDLITHVRQQTWNAALDAALERLANLAWTDHGGYHNKNFADNNDLVLNPKTPSFRTVLEEVDALRKPNNRQLRRLLKSA